MKRSTLITSIIVAVLALAALIYGVRIGSSRQIRESIESFEDCSRAGYPILQTSPEQCATPDGRTFTRAVEPPPSSTSTPAAAESTATQSLRGPSAPSKSGSSPHATTTGTGTTTASACVVSGCSGEVCSDTSEVSSCIYKEAFACYKQSFARCERQASGQCGWTENSQLKSCLAAGGPS